ncbi:MAG TPA: HEAT repeat domain-containing protein, partial [Minicystis sp.]|nr:HEAT repeat domain-containing protein [Minicystis sp.]
MRGDSIRRANLLAEALASPEVEDRRQATSLLGVIDLAQALPMLVQALGDEDWRVRKEAAAAARAFLGERGLVQELVRVLGPGYEGAGAASDNVGLRIAAVEVLAAAGPLAPPALAVALASLDA